MFNKFRKVGQTGLQEALDACARANKDGYSVAKDYLNSLKKSIDKASAIIDRCIKEMKNHHVNDESMIDNIKNQLQIVQTEFEKTYYDTKENLSNKYKTSSKFNITLFGRTKVGKSTLMEILTHGDGSRMGKGGQRTTTDVRQYEWNGMCVTDVPGIDAYGEGGEEDEKKAEEAAVYADLILFMITAGQPEGIEADWMVKLKRMDKPMVCICNFKQSIGEGIDDFRLKRLLDNPQKIQERMNINGLVEQFNDFLNEQLPSEHVKFIVTHLLAEFYSQQDEYRLKWKELKEVSRFADVEQSIINEVYNNGVLHRKKCYLSIIDAPLYRQMVQLFEFSSSSYSQFRIIQDKYSGFKTYCENFNIGQKKHLINIVDEEYNKLRNSVPTFVRQHLEDDDVSKSWERHLKDYKIEENIKKETDKISHILEAKVSEIFSELDTEIKFTSKINMDGNLGNYKFVDWKKGAKWTGLIGSTGLTIAAIVLSSGPLGWAAGAVTVVFSILSRLFTSREDKLDEKRGKLTKKLNNYIDSSENDFKKKVEFWYDKNILLNQKKAANRLNILKKSMLSLSNGERELALGYNNNHKEITKMIIANIFYQLRVPMTEFDRIICVARVPGRRIAIVIKGIENLPLNIKDLSCCLGNKETINIIKLKTTQDVESQIIHLLNCFKIKVKPLIKKVNDESQTIVYLHDNNYNQEQLDSLNLIQQIVNVHIIIK